MHVLIVTPEVAPFSSSGDLGELLGVLPRALQEHHLRVTVVTPFYRDIDPERFGLAHRLRKLEVPLGAATVPVSILDGKLPTCDVPVIFIDHPESFQRAGYYGDEHGPYADNHRRFFLLCRAALAAVIDLGLEVDVVHAHDWQTGFLPLLVRHNLVPNLRPLKTVFSLNDVSLAPLYEAAVLDELRIGHELYNPDGIEFHGKVSPIKAGVLYADSVTAPSPSYARELQTEELGCGLHGLFAAVSAGSKVHGVLPGLDTSAWNPATDHRLAERYTADSAAAGKEACKRALQTQLGLQSRGPSTLCAMLGALSEPKGISLVLRAAPQLLQHKIQLVLLGRPTGEAEGALRDLAAAYPESVAFSPQLTTDDLHRALAGADALLIPSRHEPGGLQQLKALRYGAVPVVHAVGGLRDTVVDFDAPTLSGTGICFSTYTDDALAEAVRRLVAIHADAKLWPALVRSAMQQSYPWEQAAQRHLQIYSQA